MNIYSLLKANRLIKSNRVKLLGILALHSMKRRYYGIFFDPVLACNLRCQMCYFSDNEKRKELHGSFSKEDISLLAKKFFPYALKLQIGCGAEPTMYKDIPSILSLAKQYSVPYISMTSNANRLTYKDLEEYIQKGLNEITISLHGVHKQTYERLMVNGDYEKFIESIENISQLKKKYPNFKLRINYTINSDNVLELADFFSVFGKYDMDILQFRPIQKIGESEYNNFSWQKIIDNYDVTLGKLKEEAKRRNITIICPSLNDLTKENNNESIVFDYTYIYISPNEIYKDDFNLNKDSFLSYNKRKHLKRNLLKKIFSKKLSSTLKTKLNYEVN